MKQRKKMRRFFMFFSILVLALSACSPAPEEANASGEPEAEDQDPEPEEETPEEPSVVEETPKPSEGPRVPDDAEEAPERVEEAPEESEPEEEASEETDPPPEESEPEPEKKVEEEEPGSDCDESYPELCLPTPEKAPPKVEPVTCRTLEESNFKVLPPDPYALDADGNGIGCEDGEEIPPTRAGCDPWPGGIALVLKYLPLPDDLCLQIKDDGGEYNGRYSSGPRTVLVNPTDDKDELLGVMIHELCHANQHRAVIDNGAGASGFSAKEYFATPQGREFLEANDAAYGPDQGFMRNNEGAIAPCVQWYVEASGLDPGGMPPPWEEEILSWAEKWFPLWPDNS